MQPFSALSLNTTLSYFSAKKLLSEIRNKSYELRKEKGNDGNNAFLRLVQKRHGVEEAGAPFKWPCFLKWPTTKMRQR